MLLLLTHPSQGLQERKQQILQTAGSWKQAAGRFHPWETNIQTPIEDYLSFGWIIKIRIVNINLLSDINSAVILSENFVFSLLIVSFHAQKLVIS